MKQSYLDFWNSLEKNTNAQIMAIDYGQKKLGLAIASVKVKIPVPLLVLQRKSLVYDKGTLVKALKDYKIVGLVVGISLIDNPEINKKKQEIEKYLQEVGFKDIPLVWIDESYTTKIADSQMKDLGLSRKKRNQIDDKVAATILLQDFFRIVG